MKTKLGKEIHFKTSNEPGTIAKVTDAIAKKGVNVYAMCAWGDSDTNEGNFMLYTDNNPKAIEALKGLGYRATEEEAIFAELPNQPGTLAKYARKLGEQDIDVYYSYCTVTSDGKNAFWVFSTNNNTKALKALA